MIVPKELAQALIEHIDLAYLQYNGRSGNKEGYLSYAEHHMSNNFSIEWSKGGTYGTCWDDELREVDAEDEPEMEVLQEFLSKYYPNLTDEQKDSILSCVEEDDDYDTDYYGGSTSKGIKKLSFEALANELISLVYNDVDNDSLELIDFNELLEEHSNMVINIYKEDYHKLNLMKELSENLTVNPHTKKMKI